MVTTVNLQDMYPYPTTPIKWLLWLILIFVIVLVVRKGISYSRKKPYPVINKPVQDSRIEVTDSVKKTYLQKIDKISEAYKEGRMAEKKCYQKLSILLRNFVKESTGVDTLTSTYEDIKGLGIPALTELIGMYYEPEFGVPGNADEDMVSKQLEQIIEKTGTVIKTWK